MFGVFIFIVLYFIAAFLYPGGSTADKASGSFSLLNNYWFDLLSYKAKGGENNISRPIAITAMVVLCLSLSVFWYHLPQLLIINLFTKTSSGIVG